MFLKGFAGAGLCIMVRSILSMLTRRLWSATESTLVLVSQLLCPAL